MTLLDPVVNYLLTCGKKTITLGAVVSGAQRERKQVLRVMDKLAREGFLRQVSDKPVPLPQGQYGQSKRNPTWRIIRDLTARPKPNLPRKQSVRSRIWKAVRAKRRFTKPDLAILAEATTATVDEYVRQLEKKGYVRRTGRDGRLVTYMLIKVSQVEPPRGLFVSAAGGGA